MKKRTVFGWMSAAAVALCVLSAPAFATVQTIDLNQVFTGAEPGGTAPWLTATFTYNVDPTTGTADSGTLVLQSNLASGGFVQGANGVIGWGFYLSGNSVADFDCSAGCADTVTDTVNSGSVPGVFNLGFGWKSGDRFGGSDTVTYDLSFDNAFTTSPFVANGSGWLSYAHVQGLAAGGGSCSGFIVSGTGTPQGVTDDCGGGGGQVTVPEPAELGVFGLGLLLIGGFVTWRRRRYC